MDDPAFRACDNPTTPLRSPSRLQALRSRNLRAQFSASVTRRVRARRLKSGAVVEHVRYVVNYREPGTDIRRQQFFERRADAVATRDEIVAKVKAGEWPAAADALTVRQALEHWLATRKHQVKANTWESYKRGSSYVVGPLLLGSVVQRRRWSRGRLDARADHLLPMLGDLRVSELTTGQIRIWHSTLVEHVGTHTAHAAKRFLRAALMLAAEDHGARIPSMPSQLKRRRGRSTKQILTVAQVGALLAMASDDAAHGLYYAFPFLTGVRPSEQLGLLWQDIDWEDRSLRIQRVQEADGSLTTMTKTASSARVIPMAPLLVDMLRAWKADCPCGSDGADRVFPSLGRRYAAGRQPIGAGRPLSYVNFRAHYWKPAFARCGLPYVTPHSARHTFISVMQSCGIEVGLVSKLAGHASATITLSYYTQAVRGGEDAIALLASAYLRKQP